MTNSVTTLTCPSCGGRLQISKSISRFACGYCGNEQIVHRESGIVYLEPIAEDVRHIRTSVEEMRMGVDRTAAELAVARLTKELGHLETELVLAFKKNLTDWLPISTVEWIVIVVSLGLFFTLAATRGNPAAGILWMISLVVSFLLLLRRLGDARKLKKEAIDDIRAEIAETKAMLERNRNIVTYSEPATTPTGALPSKTITSGIESKPTKKPFIYGCMKNTALFLVAISGILIVLAIIIGTRNAPILTSSRSNVVKPKEIILVASPTPIPTAAPTNTPAPTTLPAFVARCLDVPEDKIHAIETGLTVDGSGSLDYKTAQAVKSNDFKKMFFIAAAIQGQGFTGKQIGIWASNDLSPYNGLIFAVDAMAGEFSDWGLGSRTDAHITQTDDGAWEAENCVQYKQAGH